MKMGRQVTLAVAAILLGACGGPKDESATAPAAPANAPAPETADGAAPAANPAALALTCAAPFTASATAATLADAFGVENVVPETIDGPEGEKLNVTAIYPKDPAKRIEVYFKDEEARTGLVWATVKQASSVWSGPEGIRIGETVDRVQTINGGVFQIAGWGWDYGGYVTDWNGGKLNETAPGCMTSVRFKRAEGNNDRSIEGEPSHPSDNAAVRAAKPVVSEFGIHW
jgi:hypothetical protein